ncbi:DUF3124 domain-containing protein [Saccharicrinis sp. FJH62]|uniref:DUF3124 domain-containing protein n=1 Tax=Saccharicrinis sp. FJH62 TaxID=3344657 RepID=UPI0035D4F01E
MKTLMWSFALLLVLSSCSLDRQTKIKKRSHPSHIYNFVDITHQKLGYKETDYVPVYSDIYHKDGSERFLLTTTLSIRNTSFTDSAYIVSAVYNDSYGKKLAEYIDSTILLSPLESIEFVVGEKESQGGAGAHFLVDWTARDNSDQLLIQTVMIGSYGQQGISFTADAKIIKSAYTK